jgi:hypothetical protein
MRKGNIHHSVLYRKKLSSASLSRDCEIIPKKKILMNIFYETLIQLTTISLNLHYKLSSCRIRESWSAIGIWTGHLYQRSKCHLMSQKIKMKFFWKMPNRQLMSGLIEAFFIVGAWAIGAVRIPSVVMREREQRRAKWGGGNHEQDAGLTGLCQKICSSSTSLLVSFSCQMFKKDLISLPHTHRLCDWNLSSISASFEAFQSSSVLKSLTFLFDIIPPPPSLSEFLWLFTWDSRDIPLSRWNFFSQDPNKPKTDRLFIKHQK